MNLRKLTYCSIVLFLIGGTVKIKAQQDLVSDIAVEGNSRLRNSFVLRASDQKIGRPLDSMLLQADMIRLKRMPAVSHAYFNVQKQASGHYRVVYTIEKNSTLIPQLNIYTTNDDEFAYRIGLYEFNTLGQNIAFGGFFQKDIYDSYGINFRAPFLINSHIGLAVNFQDLTTREPVFLDEGVADYKYNNTSFEVLGLYSFNLRHSLEVGLTLFNEDYTYLEGATNPNIPQDFNIDKILYKGIYNYDDLDYYYQYVDGFKNTLNFQYVISSEATLPDFLIGWNDIQYYKRIGEKGNWASRLRLGLASNKDSPFAPFSVDNNLNIRGVGNIIDRGTGAIVLNTEYRHTVYEKKWFGLQLNGFIDAGTWRNPGGDFGDFGDDQNLRVYPGVGLRFIHKRIFNAIFRIDYGYGITPDATSGFVFGIGQYF